MFQLLTTAGVTEGLMAIWCQSIGRRRNLCGMAIVVGFCCTHLGSWLTDDVAVSGMAHVKRAHQLAL